MRILVSLIVIAAGCGGAGTGNGNGKPGDGHFLPSGLSAGQACQPSQCPSIGEAGCPDRIKPLPASCVTDAFNRCHWEGGGCPAAASSGARVTAPRQP
jgi:hypothetical protein